MEQQEEMDRKHTEELIGNMILKRQKTDEEPKQ